VWTSESRNVAENIRKIVAEIPGFEELKARLEEEAGIELEMKSESEDTAEVQSSRRTHPSRLSLNSVNTRTIDSYFTKMPNNSANKMAFNSHTRTIDSYFTKIPYNSANKMAFNSHCTREKNCSRYSKRKQVSKKKAMKTNTKIKSGKRGRPTSSLWKKLMK